MADHNVTPERIREGFKQFQKNLQVLKDCKARFQETEQELREAEEKKNG